MKPWMVMALLSTLVGCSEQSGAPASGALQGERNQAGSYLAYEHHIDIELPAERIGERIAAAREACLDARFGSCSLIAAQQSSGRVPRGELTLRIVPEGVEAITVLASEGGEQTSRSTHTEDLAQVVHDNRRQFEQLQRQQQTLQQFEKRADLAVADLLALAREQAELEIQLQAIAQQAAQQQRRMDTNLLSLSFISPYESSPLGRIGEAFSNLTDNLIEGTANLIEFIGYSLPFLIVLFPLALSLRKLWRRLGKR
ncbi:DUF4349 domain-containing protein [Pseudomonas sp. 5P_3.1_Bac2]|uniref:DUF4349 domain-containing protein n=1 Tax=Pseudomonas sp. 5P_3.1_Bac2 TaxID=2971617 RepID=UPI0021C803AA|nr:DUF4349 domain-containing protein [Pseudomonas sp. 5P_3.1_Bac2]MCU1716074.1 DUF4349 domain-containing protein [Pseudomonas sp. 5P_3.1_Bac2]